MDSPKVSIVIALFNKELFLQETIKSIQSQDITDWELIIVDDCSTDNSVDILKPYLKKDNRIRFFQNEVNRGANFCRNLGIKVAEAPYIIFLDADDLLSEACLSKRLAVMKENVRLDFCVSSMGVFKKEPGDMKGDWISGSKNPLAGFLSHRLPWALPQPIWKASFLHHIGGFDEEFLRLQDVELHTKALFTEGVNFKQLANEPDCFYRIANERVNFNSFELLSRYVVSTKMFCSRFFPLAKEKNLQNKLLGTVYSMYTRVLNNKKNKEISNEQFFFLEAQLLEAADILPNLKGVKRYLFLISKLAAKLPIRISGINWTLSRLIEL